MRIPILLFALSLAAAAQSQTLSPSSGTPVLVELFTSEGCSSCPPADRYIEYLDSQPISGATFIVLSEHVDYWDRLGWKDPYSSHELTERQLTYGKRFRLSDVYTPQFVIDGSKEVLSDEAKIQTALHAAAQEKKVEVHVNVSRKSSNRLSAKVTSGPISTDFKNADLYLAVALNHAETKVNAGENAKKTLSHTAVVRRLIKIGSVKNGAEVSQTIEIKTDEFKDQKLRVVAFIQDRDTGKIYGAAMARVDE